MATLKFIIRSSIRDKSNPVTTKKLDLCRIDEINLNKTRCDLISQHQLFSHNFPIDPSCKCGHRSQTIKHLFFQCPLLYNHRVSLLSDLWMLPSFNSTWFDSSSQDLRLQTLLCGYHAFPQQTNRMIVCRTAVFLGGLLGVLWVICSGWFCWAVITLHNLFVIPTTSHEGIKVLVFFWCFFTSILPVDCLVELMWKSLQHSTAHFH
jgi:hypothetical protein